MVKKIAVNTNRKSISDIESDVNEIAGNHDKIERPHKISFNITSKDLMKFKMFCISNKVKQQDQAYEVFKNWLDSQQLNL